VSGRTDRPSLRWERVTYVLGITCHPCVRNGPGYVSRGEWI
jgi:hypothetical protein